ADVYRIEWVWLHWSEYLEAYKEFELWLTKQQRSHDVELEAQLGAKEKLWQVDQQRVVVSDIKGQAVLLERLLDEAAALHNRTQDPSVDPQAQERLQEAYNHVRDRAEERLSLLQKICEEHQTYQGCVQRFQSWLLSKTKELTEVMGRNDIAEEKLKALKALDDSVACEEKALLDIEGMVESLRPNTSPAGVEEVVEEAEELRLGWQRLREGLCKADEGLRSSLDTHSQYMTRCQRLGDDIGRLRELFKGLDQELEETQDCRDRIDHTEEQMVGQWTKYTVGLLTISNKKKAQFRFQFKWPLYISYVLCFSVKCRATRLCSESELGLRNILQDPLLVYDQWKDTVSQVLETSAEVTDFSHVAMLVQKIECLLKESVQLQERFSLLEVKGDLLDSVFGPERSDGLQSELSTAMRNRELLHVQLQQRKSRLQVCMCTKFYSFIYFSCAHLLLCLQVILKDVEDYEAQVMALETLVSSSQTNRIQFEKLCDEWKHLHIAVKAKVDESDKTVAEHERFHDSLLNIEKWLMIMKQKLMSFHSPTGEWSIEGRRHEAERALGEFPEKELQLQQVDIQGQGVLKKTSEEGQVHILGDMKRLKDSWLALYEMSLNLHRYKKNEVDFSGHEQGVSNDKPIGGNSSVLAEDGEEAVLFTQASYPQPPMISSGDDSTEAGGCLISGGGVGEIRRPSAKKASATPGSQGHHESRRKEFDSWLFKQNELLSQILSSKGAAHSAKDVRLKQDTLKSLRADLSWGQKQFQLLIQDSQSSEAGTGPKEEAGLEDLRYRWMLYKSKLKDVRDVRNRISSKQKPGLLQRVCRLALPLWLLFLALLLLAFLLPLMDEGNSCSLSNNFARSFNIMLRYEGPPPT
uniref:Spectrin repeat containing nuclear envelope family member 3 n=1 Tax=Pundamilia nyererei TaxID=303518 RepID=A0A3B4GQY2_9CICH